MSVQRGEISLRDLVSWEPELRVLREGASAQGEDPLDRDVDWVVTARPSAPMLPPLRGGELVLMPHHIALESGVPLPMLLSELAGQPVAGVVLEHPSAAPGNPLLPVLGVHAISAELETELNRLLTARRGDLLRTGVDIEHAISELNARNARPGELIESLSSRLGLGITVTTANGAIQFSTTDQAEARRMLPGAPAYRNDEWLQQPLQGQRVLWIGPVTAEQRALGRLVIRRVREGIQRALDQADASAPHGSARIQALNALLQSPASSSPEQLVANALRAGIPVGTHLRIALFPNGERQADARRRIAAFGAIHDAGVLDGLQACIVTAHESRARTVQVATPAATELLVTIAFSSTLSSARHVPEGVRQARYIAALQQRCLLQRNEAMFDDYAHLGAFRLLYDRWGSPELHRYVESLVGALLREDRRGMLRETLRVYLEHGGAQRPTAERLGIHRNTLSYRLRQIRSVLAIDPDDPQGRLGLHLALLAADLPPAPPVM
jgi:purine catabolism regulator